MTPSRTLKRAAAPLRASLGLHPLDDRIVPAAPVIHNFASTQVSAGLWMLTGSVTDDESVGGLAVAFSGPAEVDGLKADVETDGSFVVFVNVSVGGTVEATVEDWTSLVSDPVYTSIYP